MIFNIDCRACSLKSHAFLSKTFKSSSIDLSSFQSASQVIVMVMKSKTAINVRLVMLLDTLYS